MKKILNGYSDHVYKMHTIAKNSNLAIVKMYFKAELRALSQVGISSAIPVQSLPKRSDVLIVQPSGL